MKRVAIVGGGAAGLAAAVAAARQARAGSGAAVEVGVYEADERVGRSILASGNGRCNFSNARIDAGLYRNAAFVDAALAALAGDAEGAADAGGCGALDAPGAGASAGAPSLPATDPALAFFADLGLSWREEGEGRLYPYANKASSVLDVLRAACEAEGVREHVGAAVERVDVPTRAGERFHLRMADGRIEHADAVIVACGGRWREARRGLLPDRYPFVARASVLGPLKTDGRVARGLDGIRVRGAVWLLGAQGAAVPEPDAGAPADEARAAADARAAWARELGSDVQHAPERVEGRPLKAREEGEVLFRPYGVSGIAVFNLSRFARPGDELRVDLLPHVRACACEQALLARRARLARAAAPLRGGRSADRSRVDGGHAPFPAALTCEGFLRGLLLPQVARAVLQQAHLRPDAEFSASAAPALARAIKGLRLAVAGVGDAKQCQVARGGWDVSAFDPATMGSRADAGLFAAGEALDVDAPCGGYNLHWAWASGLLAGHAAARFLVEGAAQGAGVRTAASAAGSSPDSPGDSAAASARVPVPARAAACHPASSERASRA